MKKDLYWSMGLGLLAVLLFVLFPALRTDGLTVFSDLDFGLFSASYIERMASPWNELWSNPNFFNITRFPLVAPLWAITQGVNLSGAILQKIIFFVLLFGSGANMFFLLTRFLQTHFSHLSRRPMWAICVVGGLLYMLNPWVIVRIQHLYLLVGYAVLPLLFWTAHQAFHGVSPHLEKHVVWRLLGARSVRGALLATSVLWAVAAGAVHYLFFSGFLVAGWALFQMIRAWVHGNEPLSWAIGVRFFFIGASVVGLLAYFFVPQIGASLLGSIEPNNVNTIDSLVLFSRHSQWHRVLLGMSYWWPMFDLSSLHWSHYAGGGLLAAFAWGGAVICFRHSFVRFFALFGAGCFLLAMGTQGPLAEGLVWLVFDAPFAGPLGFLFRDPNKFLGLFLFCFVLLFACVAASLFDALERKAALRAKEIIAIRAMLGQDIRKYNWTKYTVWALPVLFCISYASWVYPSMNAHLWGYLTPSNVPGSYIAVNSFLEMERETSEVKGAKTIFLPRNELVRSPGYDTTQLTWNEDRATAGIDLYSSRVPTYNTTEGTTANIPYWYSFLFDSLENGKTNRLGGMLRQMGVGNVVYHTDVVGYGDVNQLMNTALREQLSTLKYGQLGLFDFFTQAVPTNRFSRLRGMLYSTEGYMGLESLSALPGWRWNRLVHFLAGEADSATAYDAVSDGDIIHMRFLLDVVLDRISPAFRVSVADRLNYADSFTRWAKTRVTTPDWQWHLDHLNLLERWDWGMTNGNEIAFTYAPRMIDAEPYDDLFALGEPFLTANDFADREESFFVTDDPEVMEVEFAPTSTYDHLPFVKGEISRGKEAFWKVASSQFIDVKPLNGYTFGLTLSGRAVNQLHGKVKYYDADGEELTVSYISSPSTVETFDFIKFSGTFITPPNVARMKLQLWTHQRPTQKLYWWLHDVTMRDLGNITMPNVLTRPAYVAPKYADEPHRLFARVLHSAAGGRVQLSVNGQPFELNTKTDGVTRFTHVSVAKNLSLRSGTTLVDIENLEGFNAVAEVYLLPESVYVDAVAGAKTFFSATQTLITLEPETQGLVEGNLQTKRFTPTHTNGRGVRLSDGLVTLTFDVAETATYGLSLRTEVLPKDDATRAMTLLLYDDAETELHRINVPQTGSEMTESFVNLGSLKLPAGRITAKVVLEDFHPSLLQQSAWHPFEYDQEWQERYAYRDTLGDRERNLDCCDCVDLGEDYIALTFQKDGAAVSTMPPGCSCWWVISASNIAPVQALDEYWLSFESRASFARRNHYKVIFLDKDKVQLGYHILKNTLAEDTYTWTETQRMITPPERTAFMQLQVWSRQNRFTESQMAVRNLQMKRYKDLPLFDALVLHEMPNEESSLEAFLQNETQVPNRALYQLNESRSKLWSIEGAESTTQFGLLNGFIAQEPTAKKPTMMANKWHKVGLIISGITLLVLLVLWRMAANSWRKTLPRPRLPAPK